MPLTSILRLPRRFSRPAPVPADRLDPATIPWLMLSAFVTVAPHFESFPIWLSLFAALLLVWRGILWQHGRDSPGAFWLFLLAVAGSGGILAEYRTIFGREAGVALLAMLMMLKLLELRAGRDGIVVVMLSYFLLLTHYFVADSIQVGIWMLIALTLTTAALIRLQSPSSDTPRNTIKRAARLIGQSMPVMLILFILFPRITGPLWGLPQDLRRTVPGLSEEMSPGSISSLSQSSALAFRVEFADRVPPRESLYWRGPVMTDFDGRTWRTARGQRPGESGSAPRITPLGNRFSYTMTIEPHHQRWLLALDAPVQLPVETSLGPSLSVLAKNRLRDRTRFDFVSATDYRAGQDESAATLQRALALPSGNNLQSLDLGRQWRAEISGKPTRQPADIASLAIADRALTLFREQRFAYTLNPPLLGNNPIDEFLFQTRRGFCEHYAAAFVFLMRAAGVPARVVGGYQGGELNPLDGVLTVRQSDAHAWAEIWVAGQGWKRFDPTAAIAPSRVDQGLQAALPEGETVSTLLRVDLDWLRAMRYRWDAINNTWNVWVIGYNGERQREMLQHFGLTADWRSLVTLLSVSGSLIALVLAFWILKQPAPTDPALRLWLIACRRFGDLGIPRLPGEGPSAYAIRIGEALPERADLANSISSLYIQLRYEGTNNPKTLQLLRQSVATLPRRPLSSLLSR